MTIRESRCRLIVVIIIAVVLSHLGASLLATTKDMMQFACPVCDGRFEGYTVGSTNTFGGQDRDFFARAAGEQPILLSPKTCPACFYSGYPKDFESGADISQALRERILHQKVLKPMVSIDKAANAYEIPPYVRYDLIAQTYQLRGKTDKVIARQFLCASWAVRAESRLPATILGEELVKEVGDWKTSQWNREEAARRDNRALYHIQKGRQYAEAAKSLEGETRMIAVLAAAGTLRRYGENTEARRVLSALRTLMPEKQYAELEQFLDDSIARERVFQSRAVSLFETVIQNEDNSRERASLTYLCGELHRRLENWDKAESYYEQCLALDGRPAWLAGWVKEQKELLPQ